MPRPRRKIIVKRRRRKTEEGTRRDSDNLNSAQLSSTLPHFPLRPKMSELTQRKRGGAGGGEKPAPYMDDRRRNGTHNLICRGAGRSLVYTYRIALPPVRRSGQRRSLTDQTGGGRRQDPEKRGLRRGSDRETVGWPSLLACFRRRRRGDREGEDLIPQGRGYAEHGEERGIGGSTEEKGGRGRNRCHKQNDSLALASSLRAAYVHTPSHPFGCFLSLASTGRGRRSERGAFWGLCEGKRDNESTAHLEEEEEEE